jgi:hypothetical protein
MAQTRSSHATASAIGYRAVGGNRRALQLLTRLRAQDVFDRLAAADKLARTVFFHPHLRRASYGIVVAAHRVAVSPRIAQNDDVADFRARERPRLEFLIRTTAGEHIAAFAKRSRDDDWLGLGAQRFAGLSVEHFDLVITAVHRRADEIDKSGIHHRERRACAFRVRIGRLHVVDLRHERATRRDVVTTGLDFES